MKKIFILFILLSFISCSTYMKNVSSGSVVLENGETISFKGNVFFDTGGSIVIYSNENGDKYYDKNIIKEIHLIK